VMAAKKLSLPRSVSNESSSSILSLLKNAAYFSMITIYAQGFHLLKVASETMKYNIELKNVARIWRGGCIIRSSLLEPIIKAYANNPSLTNIMTDNFFS